MRENGALWHPPPQESDPIAEWLMNPKVSCGEAPGITTTHSIQRQRSPTSEPCFRSHADNTPEPQTSGTSKKHSGCTRKPSKDPLGEKCPWGRARPVPRHTAVTRTKVSTAQCPVQPPTHQPGSPFQQEREWQLGEGPQLSSNCPT